ncbi:MAG: hypothetical protein WCF17_15175 [Terracidiphilus sp.]
MRIASTVLILFTALSIPAFAASFDENKIPDEQMISALEQRAATAPAKDQCFLYAVLVRDMVEISAQQYEAGDVAKANSLLKRAQVFTHKLQAALATNDKRLKDAQIILRRTAFRLNELLHSSDYDDRPLMQQTLAEVNRVQVDTMMQVFKK